MAYIEVTDGWRESFPGASAGFLALEGVINPPSHSGLDARKDALVTALHEQYGNLNRAALKGMPVFQAYSRYYDRFRKTYHVQLQLESILWKGRSIPHGAVLVEAMFMSELKHLLLTAGHDMDALSLPVVLDVSNGEESYTPLYGVELSLKPGDMYMRDGEGVISSIIYGPDNRTQITPETTRVLFAVYAPAGVAAAAVQAHLEEMEENVRLVAPKARRLLLEVVENGE
jgi:DNA/RNA-binding domain of Phe-tRNA-synthetase-like protein